MDRHQRSPIGSLYRIGADRRLQCYDSGFTLANGIGWSPDDRRMYFVETGEKRIYQFDFDPEVGEISNRSVLVQLDATAGEPDGLCVDSKGNIWVALFDAGRLNRYRDNGILDRTLPMPVRRPTSCCLGGVALDTLYITSAKIGHLPGEDDSMGAGGLWAVEVECPGRPENEFG